MSTAQVVRTPSAETLAAIAASEQIKRLQAAKRAARWAAEQKRLQMAELERKAAERINSPFAVAADAVRKVNETGRNVRGQFSTPIKAFVEAVAAR